MAKKSNKKKLSPIGVIVTLLIIVIIYMGSLYIDTVDPQSDGTDTQITTGIETVSGGALGEVEYHFIDVGQGDSTLIRTPEGDILIDAGENSAEEDLRNYLDLCGVEVIYYAIFTHPDSDHIGGADMILAEYEVLNVIKPELEKDTKVYTRMMEAIEAEGCTVYNALPGETYSLGEFDMFVFGPDPDNKDLDSNNSSIVLKATWGNTTAMLTGDAEEPAEESILATFSAAELGSMLLKMGHHGSKTSSTDEWLAAVRPTIAVISCGKDNKYGHPHAEVLARIKKYVGESIYRTDELGSIVFITDGETFTYQD